MIWLSHVLRVLVGALFVLYGASKFHPFMPMPPVPTEALSFIGALLATGYLWPLVGLVEVVGGVLLMTERFAFAGLCVLAPVIVNIVPYLLLLVGRPPAFGMATLLMTASAVIVWRERARLVAVWRAATA